MKLKHYPKVTITVPCFNEEKTIDQTVKSLLNLDYPKDKIEIFLVDDGSTDNTWSVLGQFEKYPNIRCFKKENGGKHTALNIGIEHSTGEFVGGLDSDSMVEPQALKRIMKYFENDAATMAVSPSIMVHKPKSFIQKAQSIEYHMAVYNKKMLAFVGGINVTPGPFSIFRKSVFEKLGPYRKAYNTEDQEIALRMQKNGYKIEHCPDARVYCNSPKTTKSLYKQRLRWVNGFIRNFMDYRSMVFRRKYGAIGMFTLPVGIISIAGIVLLFWRVVYSFGVSIVEKVESIKAIGLFASLKLHSGWFYMNTKTLPFLLILLYALIILSTLIGRQMAERRTKISFSLVYFFFVYTIIAPFWILKAVYTSLANRETNWVAERSKSS